MATNRRPSKAKWLVPALLMAAMLAIGCSLTGAQAGQSPANCTGERFPDVCSADWYYPYVSDLAGMGAITGYPDGYFHPSNNISRGQIIKVLITATGLTAALPSEPTFQDVPAGQTFYQWVEIGVARGVASGYPCGGPGEPCVAPGNKPYFRPGALVTRAQLAKMIDIASGWQPYYPTAATFNDVSSGNSFFGYIERAAQNGAIGGYACGGSGEPCPGLYFRPYTFTTRAQASKMVDMALGNHPRPTATSTPAGGGPCPLFPSNNIWTRNISALPVHPMSDAYINSMGLSTGLHTDFGSGLWEGAPIGIPFVIVPSSQPAVPINFTDYGDESDAGPYPVPTNAPIEGGPNSSGDRHVLVIRQGECRLYEMYSSYPNSDGSWNAGSGATWYLNSNALRPAGWTSADAAGLPIYAGLARYDEVATGVITHALRFTAAQTQKLYLWPARHYASSSTDPNLPPMGLRVRLKAGVDISGYPQQLRVILQAMKDYGMILADNGSNWYISGAPDERWNNDILHQIGNIHGSDFEAVDESSLMVDPNSGESR